MLVYSIISSGSCGNCYCFYDGLDSIVIDFGISTKKFLEGMEQSGIPAESVRAIFITHLHPDHAGKSLGVFLKGNPVPLFINKYSAKKDHHRFVSLNLPSNAHVRFFDLSAGLIKVGGFTIRPMEAFHDSPGCVNYYAEGGGASFCLITDTGYFSQEMVDCANASGLLFLESNYDDEMLENGKYAPWLKKRIRSEDGHLSNEQASRFLLKLDNDIARQVFLVHLSENNNTPEAALKASLQASAGCASIRAMARGEFYRGQLE